MPYAFTNIVCLTFGRYRMYYTFILYIIPTENTDHAGSTDVIRFWRRYNIILFLYIVLQYFTRKSNTRSSIEEIFRWHMLHLRRYLIKIPNITVMVIVPTLPYLHIQTYYIIIVNNQKCHNLLYLGTYFQSSNHKLNTYI